MDHRYKALIALSLFGAAGIAHAGYAQAVPPAGWSAAGFNGSVAVNAATFAPGTATAPAALNTGGRLVTFPATMRFAANAPRLAAAAIMLHPGVRTAAAVVAWLGVAGLVYNQTTGLWEAPDYSSNGYVSQGGVYRWWTAEYPEAYSAEQACAVGTAQYGADNYVFNAATTHCQAYRGSRYLNGANVNRLRNAADCPAGWFVTTAGCVQSPPPKTVTQEEAIEELIRHPMPAEVPRHLPVPLPVELPDFPPFFVPSSDPLPNPTFDPSAPSSPSNPPQIQPGTEVRGAPSPGSPWQVSTAPVNRPVVDPSAPPVRDPVPLPEGGAPSGNEPVDPDKKGLCDQYPNILACQTLEQEDDDTKLPEKAVEFNFNPIPGFQGTKTCPAFPSVAHILGGREISWQPFCDTLAKISNLLLAFAWASAAFILLGRSD